MNRLDAGCIAITLLGVLGSLAMVAIAAAAPFLAP
jgi:hypothetical protein